MTGPECTFAGAEVLMEVSLHELMAAGRPLKVTVPPLCVAPKFEPEMVTPTPARPASGDMKLIAGTGWVITLKFTPLLASNWWSVTTTLPEVAPEGTSTAMLESLQLCTVALTPLNVTPPKPCVCPKVMPEIVTEEPISPAVGPIAVIFGTTGNGRPLVENPLTVTTIGPVVAPVGTGTVMLVLLQMLGDAATPLNVTVLAPWVSPKLVPVTTTLVPTGPEVGASLVITGMTRNDVVLLAVPPDVTITSIKPGRRLAGTGATILVSDHEVGVVLTPPMVTELPVAEVPNPLPLIVKGEPTGLTGPTVGEMLLMLGDAQAKVKLRKPSRMKALIA